MAVDNSQIYNYVDKTIKIKKSSINNNTYQTPYYIGNISAANPPSSNDLTKLEVEPGKTYTIKDESGKICTDIIIEKNNQIIIKTKDILSGKYFISIGNTEYRDVYIEIEDEPFNFIPVFIVDNTEYIPILLKKK